MRIEELQAHWHALGSADPFWAILSDPAKKQGKWDPEEFFATGEEWISEVLEYAHSLKPNLGSDRALDFGCGAGRLTQPLGRYFTNSHGVDIAPSMITLASQFNRTPERCHYHLNTAPDLRMFPDDSFDLVYTILVLQHMRPRFSQQYIAEFVRVLRPGGLIIFQIPSEVTSTGRNPSAIQAAPAGALPDAGFQASLASVDIPALPPAGRQVLFRIRVRNASAVAWPAGAAADGAYQLSLGNRWLDDAGAAIVDDDGRTILPHDLEPSAEVELPLLITLPDLPGSCLLQVDLVQEGVAWFRDRGSLTAMLPLRVTWPPSTPGTTHTPLARPAIQMFGVPKYAILRLLEACGAQVMDLRENRMAGPNWLSWTYCATK